MCLNTEGTNVMFEGRFNIVIRDVGMYTENIYLSKKHKDFLSKKMWKKE